MDLVTASADGAFIVPEYEHNHSDVQENLFGFGLTSAGVASAYFSSAKNGSNAHLHAQKWERYWQKKQKTKAQQMRRALAIITCNDNNPGPAVVGGTEHPSEKLMRRSLMVSSCIRVSSCWSPSPSTTQPRPHLLSS
jgi:hypothetical protein